MLACHYGAVNILKYLASKAKELWDPVDFKEKLLYMKKENTGTTI